MSKNVIDKYLSIVRSYYPDILPDDITLFQDGYDHDVLLVKNNQAFRFPRTKDHGKKDHVENAFLSIFAKLSPISIQDMIVHVDPKTHTEYQMYRFIPGIQLSKEVAQRLSGQELVNIARDMGKFLTKLHSFPLTEARAMRMDELDPKMYWEYFEDLYIKIKAKTFPLLSEKERYWMETLVRNYVSVTRDKLYKVQVTHHDLLAEHILIDDKTHRLNGVIDFSLRIADPARDFEFFDRYGQKFLETVYESYLPKDEYFDQRRTFYAGHVPVVNLYEAIERKDKKMTKIYTTQLREYISG